MLELARTGTAAAVEQLRGYSPRELAGAVQALAPAQRLEFFENAERVDEIVPLLPEAEFASTVRGAGIEDAGWLVEFASPEQRVAAVDLDCWKDSRFSASRLFEWLDALIEAGHESLSASFDELDPELWVLAMKELGNFSVLGLGDVPDGQGSSLDGVVFYDAHTAEGEDRITEILTAALHHAPAQYWRLVYGAIAESRVESEQFAARWHQNRLGDLGFPEREHAMRAYKPLAVDPRPVVDLGPAPGAMVRRPEGHLPVQLRGTLLGRALLELAPADGDRVLADILTVANTIAVADRLPLADTATIPRSFEKAVRGIERGLEELVRVRGQSPGAVLASVAALDLFRTGVSLDPELRPVGTVEEVAAAEQGDDWNVETEVIADEDRTVTADGRLSRS